MPCRRQRSPCGGDRGTDSPAAAETGGSWKPPAEAGEPGGPRRRRQGKPIAPPRRRLGKPEAYCSGDWGKPEASCGGYREEPESPPRRRLGKPEAPCGGDRGNRKPPAAETGLCPRGKGRTAPGIQFACMAKEGQPRGYKRIFDGDLRARRAVGAAGRGTTGRRGTSGGGVWRRPVGQPGGGRGGRVAGQPDGGARRVYGHGGGGHMKVRHARLGARDGNQFRARHAS